MEETHGRFLAYLDGVTPEAYAKDGRFLRRVCLDTYGHYIEHTEHIRGWRRAKGI
jgi:hypothetical protein